MHFVVALLALSKIWMHFLPLVSYDLKGDSQML